MQLKFFSKAVMMPHHIKALRKYRKIITNEKVIDYQGNMVDVVKFEKPIYVFPLSDSILTELDNLVINDDCSYDYSGLSSEFKRYMKEIDERCYQNEYRYYKEFERRNERSNEFLDRVLTQVDYVRYEFEEKGLEFTEEHEEQYFRMFYETLNKRKDTDYEKARRSARRRYEKVLGLIRSNLDSFENFVTMTFARKHNHEKYEENGVFFKKYVDDPYDFECVKKEYERFVHAMRQAMNREGLEFKYITVYEEHKDGAYHFHMLCSEIPEKFIVDTPEKYDWDKKTRKRRYGKMLKHWVCGISDISPIQDKERASTYVSKYILKTLWNIDVSKYHEFLNKKGYWASTNLEKPTLSYEYKMEGEGNAFSKKFTEKYEKKYNNPYNDSAITKITYSKPM